MAKTLIGIVTVLLLASSVPSHGGSGSWNFDSGNAVGLPQGFATAAGEWKVVADPDAPSQPNALAQLARNSGSTFNLVLVEGASYRDVDLSVSMKAVAGKEDQGGGLVWRAKDGRNYYVARFNPLEDNYNLYLVENGRRTQLQGATIKARPCWHTLRVTMKGSDIQTFFDGKKVLEAENSALPNPGEIGLWTKSDAQTHFDDLNVSGE